MYEKDGKHHIRLGKVTARKGLKNEGIRLHGPDIPNGTPKTCTVSRKDMGTHYEYYVSSPAMARAFSRHLLYDIRTRFAVSFMLF